ncbi:MAG: long-chain-fatty-acid--CoA ligase [Rhodobacter sp.]|nr:long-chain-fatty-acid--CoA ligase [Paracoccaceae bacterium]MCC0076447.1 long-chain-fatty-acid--CoA ligase [Rhodobacter sp.]
MTPTHQDAAARLRQVFALQQAAFARHPSPLLEARKDALKLLKRQLQRYQDALAAALVADFGFRAPAETKMLDLLPSILDIDHTLRHLRRWMKPSRRHTELLFASNRLEVQYQPKGVVGVIVPWNFPLYLCFGPLAAALAAGNRVMIKMSEALPATNAVMRRLIGEVFDDSEVAVFGEELTDPTAFTALPFDHIIFTGSPAVGRKVMEAAAAHLTPVTLELGGKSPAFVLPDYPLDQAARSLVFGKGANAGQICVSPDYALVPRADIAAFTEAARQAFATLYGSDVASNHDYSAIVNDRQFQRIAALLDDARARGATVTACGTGEGRKMALQIVTGVTPEMRLMQEEIFGPVLPVVAYDTLDEAIARVRALPRPLALYCYTHDAAARRRVLGGTHSGGVTLNDCAWHIINHDAPFGGTGQSGMGNYHGEEGFRELSHARTVFKRHRFFPIALFQPPYGNTVQQLVSRFYLGKADPAAMTAGAPESPALAGPVAATALPKPPHQPDAMPKGGPMIGQMMQQPLLISSLLTHAERHHPEQQVVTRRVEGDLHRITYRDLAARSRRLAKALAGLGMAQGTRVGTLAWNTDRHLELYYAVSGSGAVLHTLNPRLHPDQLAWIAGDADDRILCFDLTFLPLVEAVAPRLTGVRHFVLMTDCAHMPAETKIPGLLCYEDLLAAQDDRFDWPEFDENTASSLCYTSGTTGNPKGVLYSHRSTVLHTWASALPDSLGLSAADAVLPVVPMFHVNAWGLPYSACMVGAKLVLPGPAMDGKSLHDLFEAEGVTISAGVPTVWQGLLAHVTGQGLTFSTMRRTVIGGSACPPAMMSAFEEGHGVQVIHAWGMTELSPIGTIGVLKGHQQALPEVERRATQSKQGRGVYGIDMKIVDAEGAELPWDGQASGELMVRGPWVVDRYLNGADTPLVADSAGKGWFPTGDIATIDAEGFMQITDRAKDVIKSGGEWIGSIDLENIAQSHPGVAMAACVAARHPKWDERPLLIAVRKPGATVTEAELLAFFDGKIAKWWTPDAVIFVAALPLGGTGKVLKHQLRDTYRDHLLATA